MTIPTQPRRAAFCPTPCQQQQVQYRSSRRRRSQWLVAGVCLLACLSILPSQVAGDKPSSVRRPYRHRVHGDPDDAPLVGQFLHITDIHPDEHYINGGTIASSCHSTTEEDDDDDDDDDNDINNNSVGFSWRKWFGSNRLLDRFSHSRQNKDGANDGQKGNNNINNKKNGKKTTAAMRPGRTSGGHGGPYGAPYSICDSPFSLVNVTFDWIDKNLMDEIDFIVWTGDNARHDSDNEHPRTQQEIEELNRMIANKFLEAFGPDPDDPLQRQLPMVPSIGNNDVYPHNIMQAGPNRILQHFSDIWSEFIPESQYHTFQFGGYYISEVIPDRLSVVALNTLYFFNQNTAVDGCDNEDEPGTMQMDWLEVELRSLRSRKMSVYLTGHVPPARKSYSPTCFRRYTEIALKYQDVVVGHFFGHANIDHFIVLSEESITQPSLAQPPANETNQDEEAFDMEFNRASTLGLSSYLLELWEQYESIPKHAKLNNYAIANVGPSVIPTYNPSLRVYGYQLKDQASSPQQPEEPDKALVKRKSAAGPRRLASLDVMGHAGAQQHFAAVTKELFENDNKEEILSDNDDNDEEESDDDDDEEDQVEASKKKKNKKKKPRKKPHKPRKPRKPRRPTFPPSPDPASKFGFPLQYTQYWMNLTYVNEVHQEQRRRERLGALEVGQGQHQQQELEPLVTPGFVVEYRTKEDYGLETLGVQEYLMLARKIVSDTRWRDQYLAWMVVLTGTENDH